jgi:predicted dehydrogenase
MKKVIKLGVVGCGYWGPNLVRNFRAVNGCKMEVICDADEKRLNHMKSLFPELQTSADFDKTVNDPNLDAIAIATPVRFHFQMAKASLTAGKHTFIEKPMASSSSECDELVEIARKKNLTLMVGHTFLYSPPVRKMKEIVDNGDIGDIQYISSRRLNLGLFQKDINVAWDLAPHDLSIILYVMGENPESVSCSGSAHVNKGIEDVTVMYLEFKRKRCAFVHNSWLDPHKVREMTIIGSRRMIAYDDTAPLEKIKIYDTRVEVPPHYDSFSEFQYAYHYGDVYSPYIKQEEPLKVECQHFVDCIQSGKEPLTNGRYGRDLVRILEASSQSLKQGGAAVPYAKS